MFKHMYPLTATLQVAMLKPLKL